MVNYSNGKIYKIWDNGYNMCYVGSTTQSLSKRLETHRSDYKKHLRGEYNYVSVFEVFNEYGVENCKIELVEKFSCNDKEELHAREGQHQQDCVCVNKRVAGRQRQQYREDNKDTLKEKRKEYIEKNRQTIKQTNMKYREENKGKLKEKHKEYYETHKDNIRENRKVKFQCDCNSVITKCNQSRHNKSLKHQQYLKSLETMD